MSADFTTGEVRQVIINATWKACAHGGGWWVAKDADGREVLLAPDGFAEPAVIKALDEAVGWENRDAYYEGRMVAPWFEAASEALLKARGQA